MLTACVSLSAQALVKNNTMAAPFAKTFTKTFAKKAPMKVQGSTEYTYIPTGDITDADYLVGAKSKTTYLVAMYVPASLAGKTISQVNFLLYDTSVLKNIKVWESASLPTSATKADVRADSVVAESNADEDATEMKVSKGFFKNPITVPAEGCYVGFSFTVTNTTGNAGNYPLVYYPSDAFSNGVFYKIGATSSTSWNDGGESGYCFAISAVLNGDFSDCSLSATETSVPYVVAGDSATVSVALTNNGVAAESLSYTVKDLETGVTSEEKTVDVHVDAFRSGAFSFKVPSQKSVNTKQKQVTITKVNGKANEATDNVQDFAITTMSKSFPRKAVEEEFTATGCGYCCRGYAGMSYMADNYSDSWIGIAVHGSGINWVDPMYCNDYADVLQYVSGYPMAMMSRESWIDPYYGSGNEALGVDDDYQSIMAQATEASVSAKAAFDQDQNKIYVSTDVQFSLNCDSSNYSLSYVLLANGLKAPETSSQPTYWYQYDPYYGATGYEDEPYIYAWVENENVSNTTISLSGSQYTIPLNTNMTYDHVAIAAADILTGIDGSISGAIVDGCTKSHSYVFDVTNGISSMTVEGDDLIQDKSKLEVVALLLNRTTGVIVNADKCSVKTYADGIEGVSFASDNVKSAATGYYSANGMRLAAPVKGLNIVKMADGTTRKVMINK